MSANDDDLDVHTQTDLNITVSKFVDLDFPIDKFNWESLQKHKIYWKRPSDLCPSPTLYGSAISASDVRQGSLGDCFFIAALSLLCSQPDAVRKLFIDISELQEAGLYSLQFFQFGVWKRVLIDDQLPTRRLRKKPIGYRLVLGRNAQSQVFWVSLIEKAYAKLYGSYESLRGGNISEALVDLTGAPVYDYNLDATDFMAKPFWAILLRQAARGAMIGCAACLPDVADDDDDDDDDQGRTSTGIQSNHAYSIQYILAEKLDGKLRKFILVKDPQRDGQKMSFSGALTDPSKWTASEAELLSQTELHPGLFWMTWKEFRTQFNRVYICQYDLLPLCQTTSIYGDWDNDTAGGCTDYASWKCNPSYVVEGELLAISLQQPDRRTASRQNAQPLSYTMIGLTVVRPPAFEDDPFLITKPSEALCRTAFWNKRDVAVEAYETWPDRVIIVPSFHEPGLTGKFVMNIYSKGNVTVRRRQTDLKVVRQRSQWSETSSGGGPLSAGFPRNPKFLLNASISGPLRQSDSEPLVVFIGLRVLSRSSRCKMGICILKKAIYALEALDGLHGSLDKSWFLGAPSFEIQEEVNRRLEIPNDQLPVLIIPCTWEPNLQAEFELTVSSRRMATCVPILPVLSNDANQ